MKEGTREEEVDIYTLRPTLGQRDIGNSDRGTHVLLD
jgi:hypothetical protein